MIADNDGVVRMVQRPAHCDLAYEPLALMSGQRFRSLRHAPCGAMKRQVPFPVLLESLGSLRSDRVNGTAPFDQPTTSRSPPKSATISIRPPSAVM
jgi:hypothetical protein